MPVHPITQRNLQMGKCAGGGCGGSAIAKLGEVGTLPSHPRLCLGKGILQPECVHGPRSPQR